ncbi:MAG: serpin family protein [Steroidobacteraceae bacterium]
MHRRKDLPRQESENRHRAAGTGYSARQLCRRITAAQLISWNTQLQSTTGFIALPLFTATYGISLPAALTALGMGTHSAKWVGGFSGIATNSALMHSDVEHQTVIEVDEGGTVAAVAASVTVGAAAAPVLGFTMQMSRPSSMQLKTI